ncbi:MAG: stage 0 sporulation family protein [bacterium]|nr:stage 0 sporulation family protein [bacterium]
MYEIVGVGFPHDDKIYYYDAQEIDLNKGDSCVVEIEKGVEIAEVVEETKIVPERKAGESYPKVLRKTSPSDWEKVRENKRKEKKAYNTCLKKIDDKDLSMKLVDVHYTLDRSKLIFYFTSEGRIDFRELVKDLAYIFKCRIEMRQIGVRDEARMFGGFSFCGRPLCCKTFLKNFGNVSIKMAKEQNLILNSEKISGICGRLMCCIAYEYENYRNFRKRVPKEGTMVLYKDEKAKITFIDPIRERISIKFEDGRCIDASIDEIKRGE